nr:iron-sulfur cluster assembly scaffold protein [Biomaibacter acetigenes]
MYTDKVIDHFLNPRNVGEIPDADGIGQYGDQKEGRFSFALRARSLDGPRFLFDTGQGKAIINNARIFKINLSEFPFPVRFWRIKVLVSTSIRPGRRLCRGFH